MWTRDNIITTLSITIKIIPPDCLAPQYKMLVADKKTSLYRNDSGRTRGPEKIKWRKLCNHKAAFINHITSLITERLIGVTWTVTLWESVVTAERMTLGTTRPSLHQIVKKPCLWTEQRQHKVQEKKVAYKNWYTIRPKKTGKITSLRQEWQRKVFRSELNTIAT